MRHLVFWSMMEVVCVCCHSFQIGTDLLTYVCPLCILVVSKHTKFWSWWFTSNEKHTKNFNKNRKQHRLSLLFSCFANNRPLCNRWRYRFSPSIITTPFTFRSNATPSYRHIPVLSIASRYQKCGGQQAPQASSFGKTACRDLYSILCPPSRAVKTCTNHPFSYISI